MSMKSKLEQELGTGNVRLTGKEIKLDPSDILVSKTDPTGIITYANDVFIKVSGFTEKDLLGVQHSLVRHPDMPRALFKLIWDTIKSGQEIFGYIVNRCKNGDHYWVFAHLVPIYDLNDKLTGYHSTRRAPKPEAISILTPLYRQLRTIEDTDRKAGLALSSKALNDFVDKQKMSYDQFILSL